VQHAHYESARIYDRRHFFIGVPSIILSTIVGTTVFASLKEISTQSDLVWPTIIVGLLSISSAVLASLQTFLDYKGLAERHKLSGARFADLKHKLEIVATFASGDDSDLKLRLTEIEQQWEKIREESPNVPTRLWRKIEKKMTLEKDKEMHPEFGKNA
jgi:biopolymer transport protein ExbB/TolQ